MPGHKTYAYTRTHGPGQHLVQGAERARPSMGDTRRVLQLACLLWMLLPAAATVLQAGELNPLVVEAAREHYAGRLDNAERLFRQALRTEPDNTFVYNQLGVIYTKLRRYEKAFQSFRHVLAVDSENVYARQWTGILYLIREDIGNARAAFEAVLRLNPQDASALYFLGAIANILRDDDRAVEYLQKSRDADVMEAVTHYRLGVAFDRLDMPMSALAEYRKTLELNPRYVRALHRIGWIYYNAGNVTDALDTWKEGLTINRHDNDIVFSIAKTYNELGYRAWQAGALETARRYWRQTLTYKPDDKAARHFLNTVAAGR